MFAIVVIAMLTNCDRWLMLWQWFRVGHSGDTLAHASYLVYMIVLVLCANRSTNALLPQSWNVKLCGNVHTCFLDNLVYCMLGFLQYLKYCFDVPVHLFVV